MAKKSKVRGINGGFSGGFLRLRVGLFDHLEDGRIDPMECMTYEIFLLRAKWETGQWWGTCESIRAALGNNVSLSTIQRYVKNLAEKGYIKIFGKWGRRGPYGVLVNKYEPQLGPFKGKRLNARKSTDYRKPVFETIPDFEEEVRRTCGGSEEETRRICGGSAEDVRSIQDKKDVLDFSEGTRTKEGKDESSEPKPSTYLERDVNFDE